MFFLHLLPDIISDHNYNFIITEFILNVKAMLKSFENEKMAFYMDVK